MDSKLKILVITDLHGQRSILVKLDKYLEKHKYDGVFMCGDLCNSSDLRNLEYAKDFIDLIKKKHHLLLFVVHGNQESKAVKLLFQKEDISVHFKEKKIIGYSVIGVGYGETYPTDPKFAEGKILLTHEPPRVATIKHMKSIINIPNAPLVHFSGHLHYKKNVHKLGNTLLVQVPTAMQGMGVEFSLPEKKVKFISF